MFILFFILAGLLAWGSIRLRKQEKEIEQYRTWMYWQLVASMERMDDRQPIPPQGGSGVPFRPPAKVVEIRRIR